MDKKVKKALYLTGEIALHIGGFTSGLISSMAESTAKNVRNMNNPADEAFEALSETTRNISDHLHEYAHNLADKRHSVDDDSYAKYLCGDIDSSDEEDDNSEEYDQDSYDEYDQY